jgi:hypothetical protein
MSKPIVHAKPGIYVLDWEDKDIAMRLDRVREAHDHVTAELTVKSTIPGQSGHIHGPTRFNLTSTTAHKTLVKLLSEEKQFDNIPWTEMLEQASNIVVEGHRTGEPIYNLGEYAPGDGPQYLVEPVLEEGMTTIIAGDGGSGKTYFSIFLALLVSGGLSCSELIGHPGTVLYLDYEQSREQATDRAWWLMQYLDPGIAPSILYRRGNMALADDIEQVTAMVAEHDVKLIIVDSLGMALGDEPEKAGPITNFFMALRSLGITALVIHHLNREGKFYGNIYIWNAARSFYELKGQQELDENVKSIALIHKKSNNGQLRRPMGFKLTFGGSMVSVEKADVKAMTEIAGLPISLQERVTGVLKNGALTAKDIAAQLNKPENTIRAILSRHNTAYVHLADNTWGLASGADR